MVLPGLRRENKKLLISRARVPLCFSFVFSANKNSLPKLVWLECTAVGGERGGGRYDVMYDVCDMECC